MAVNYQEVYLNQQEWVLPREYLPSFLHSHVASHGLAVYAHSDYADEFSTQIYNWIHHLCRRINFLLERP